MSVSDYDDAERLFCGTWENVGNEMDEFMTAGEFPDDIKQQILDEKKITLSRVDNSLHYKTGRVEIEFVMKINETTEWKEKEENPVFYLKVHVLSFKHGVWTMEFTPMKPNGGKRHILVVTIQDEQMIYELSLPDCTGVKGKRVFRRCN